MEMDMSALFQLVEVKIAHIKLTMSKKYNLEFCVNVLAHFQTYEGIQNLNSMVEKIDVDLIKINVNQVSFKE